MQFDWDEKKRLAKKAAERGIDFADAERFFRQVLYEYPSPEKGEDRRVAVGILNDRYVSFVYHDRGDVRRIVTARRARKWEIRAYERAKDHAS